MLSVGSCGLLDYVCAGGGPQMCYLMSPSGRKSSALGRPVGLANKECIEVKHLGLLRSVKRVLASGSLDPVLLETCLSVLQLTE